MFFWPTIAALGVFSPPAINNKLFADMDFASGAKDAYGMLPPEKVCDANVKQAIWSPDGKFIAFEVGDYGLNPTSAAALFVDPELTTQQTESRLVMAWNAQTGKTQQMFVVPDGSTVDDLEWLPKTTVLLTEVDEPVAAVPVSPANGAQPEPTYTQTIGLVNPETGHFQTLYSAASKPVSAYISPIKPFGALIEDIDLHANKDAPPSAFRWQMIVQFFDKAGHMGQNITLPQNSALGWNAKTGDPVALEIVRTPGAKATKRFYSIDTTTGKLTPLAADPGWGVPYRNNHAEMNRAAGIALYTAKPALKSAGFTGVAKTIWLRVEGGTSDMAAVVTTEGEQGDIAPSGDAILYRSKGSAYVRRLFKVSKEAYAMYRKRLAQELAINNAKQTALAFLMLANDMNDILPGQGGSWQSMLGPYLNDSSISSGFNYTFAGGNMTDIDSPATTVLGYVSGPDGRAVAYTDGHVKWIPNP